MPDQLSHNTYGKHRVRVSKVKRLQEGKATTEQHELIEASVDVMLEGDFAAAYVDGDNRRIVPTDTCKNTIYVLAHDDPFETIESFGVTVASHFLKQYEHITKATVHLTEHRWQRLGESPHAFVGSDGETPTAVVVATRNHPLRVSAGLAGLLLAKTAESGFANFHRDEFCTLEDSRDRILATELTANWDYDSSGLKFDDVRAKIRFALLSRFVDHYSHSVQETLYLMGLAALEASHHITAITLTMPNKHHLLFDLTPFGRKNDNEVFVATDDPFGYITATITRSEPCT